MTNYRPSQEPAKHPYEPLKYALLNARSVIHHIGIMRNNRCACLVAFPDLGSLKDGPKRFLRRSRCPQNHGLCSCLLLWTELRMFTGIPDMRGIEVMDSRSRSTLISMLTQEPTSS
jgi:hypothetical protein